MRYLFYNIVRIRLSGVLRKPFQVVNDNNNSNNKDVGMLAKTFTMAVFVE